MGPQSDRRLPNETSNSIHSTTPIQKGPRAGIVAIGVGLLAIGGVGAWMLSSSDGPMDGGSTTATETQRMVNRLERIDSRLVRSGNTFNSDRYLPVLEAKLPTQTDPSLRLQLLGEIGYHALRAGNNARAIEAFSEVIQRMLELGSEDWNMSITQAREFIAVAHLRTGEQANCLALHGPDSCLLPLAGGGIHQDTRGVDAAIEAYGQLLTRYPDHQGYRWLLNLSHQAAGTYPEGVPEDWRIDPKVYESEAALDRFPNVAGALGVGVMALSGGVVMEDFDGDGFLDLMASSWKSTDTLRLFMGDGEGGFEERTEASGIQGLNGGLNLIHADYDNDGDADVLVLRGAWWGNHGRYPNSLLRNDGNGNFQDVTETAGLLTLHPTQTAVWSDLDGDGDLDLFIGNETEGQSTNRCELFRNDGDGTFTDIASDVGIAHRGMVKAVACGDVNGDGRPDLYLSCYETENALYLNEFDGTQWRFRNATEDAGVQGPDKSFPSWFWDFDNDGDLDLLVAPCTFDFDVDSMDQMANWFVNGEASSEKIMLYRNDGTGVFEDCAPSVGLDEPILAMGSNFGDLDNDGWLDAYFGTGEPSLATLVPNRMFLNQGAQSFANVSAAGGFGHLQKGHGVAFGDRDNDGDQDVYAVMGGAFAGDVAPNALFENPGNDNHWMTLELEGVRANRDAIGARIRVTVGTPQGPRDVFTNVGTGGSFGSSSLQQELGLGDATHVVQVAVRWPGDLEEQVWTDVPLDRFVRLTQGKSEAQDLTRRRVDLGGPSASAGS